MGLSSAFNSALTGLTTTARLAGVVSSNISNALTDGYGRREVALSSQQIGGQGGGVKIDAIVRITDRGLIGGRRLADADVGKQQQQATALQSLERTLGVVGDPSSLGGRLAAFENALISAGSDPASNGRLGLAVSRLGDVADTFRANADAIKSQRQDADAAIKRDVDILNTSLQQVEKLNTDIGRLIGSGNDPSALIDARQATVDKIASIVPIREIDRQNNQIAIYSTTGAALIDGKPAEISFAATPTIVPEMSFAGGALSGIMINGDPASLTDGFGRLSGGSLEGAFQLRDQTLVVMQSDLDNVAADFMGRFANPGVDPTQTLGDAGLITDRGLAFDPADLIGVSGRLTLNINVDPAQGGDVSRIRDGVNAVTAGPVGDASQLDRWLQSVRAPIAIGAGIAQGVSDQIADYSASIGRQRLNAEEFLSFEVARQETLKTAELATGVDSDQELQRLLQIEQSYAANARVMQTLDAMLRRVMEI